MRPNFPRHSEYLPPGVQFALLPFGEASLTHFLYLERPEGMQRLDAEGFVPSEPPPMPVDPGEVMPRGRFLGIGQEFRQLRDADRGSAALGRRLGDAHVLILAPGGPARPGGSVGSVSWS